VSANERKEKKRTKKKKDWGIKPGRIDCRRAHDTHHILSGEVGVGSDNVGNPGVFFWRDHGLGDVYWRGAGDARGNQDRRL
jgi:hypothetical protein